MWKVFNQKFIGAMRNGLSPITTPVPPSGRLIFRYALYSNWKAYVRPLVLPESPVNFMWVFQLCLSVFNVIFSGLALFFLSGSLKVMEPVFKGKFLHVHSVGIGHFETQIYISELSLNMFIRVSWNCIRWQALKSE